MNVVGHTKSEYTELEQLKAIYHTQEAIARALGVSNQTVWRWLHGVKPSALALRRMRELAEEAGKDTKHGI